MTLESSPPELRPRACLWLSAENEAPPAGLSSLPCPVLGLQVPGPEGRLPGQPQEAALALGRAYEGLGRFTEADTAYDWAAGRLPGLEAPARYAAFLARTGKLDEAKTHLTEIDRRVARADPAFRREGRQWRDLAAEAIAAQG